MSSNESALFNLKAKSIELFNSLLSSLGKENQNILFDYEEVVTEIQLIEQKIPDDNLDDICLIKSNWVHIKKRIKNVKYDINHKVAQNTYLYKCLNTARLQTWTEFRFTGLKILR